jgi:hypothetical protein
VAPAEPGDGSVLQLRFSGTIKAGWKQVATPRRSGKEAAEMTNEQQELSVRLQACKAWETLAGMPILVKDSRTQNVSAAVRVANNYACWSGIVERFEDAELIGPDTNSPLVVGQLLALLVKRYGSRLESVMVSPKGTYTVFLVGRGHIFGGVDALITALEYINE